ncbi:MAG: 30S ribosomal protein S9 [Candidatus Hecatellales archaeon]|nr:MAG: 30S ribosomal protein S9 [Candidatus Hecatellales archaeon]
MTSKKLPIITVGKRKTAIARAVLRPGSGKIRINKIPLEIYQPELARQKILEPLLLAGNLWKQLDIDVKVRGGGFMGQAEAVRMSIARGLTRWFKSSRLKKLFLSYDRSMLVGDERRKEMKKFGGPGARRRRQKSYR